MNNTSAPLPDLNQAAVSEKELNVFSRESKRAEAYQITEFLAMNENYSSVDILELAAGIGKIESETMDRYLTTAALSSSAAKEVLKTPLHYYLYKEGVIPKKAAAHFDLGSFAHMAFLEPHLFDLVKIEPNYNGATKEGVLKACDFYAELNNEPSGHSDIWKMDALRERLKALQGNCQYPIIGEEHKIIIDILKGNYYRYGSGIIPQLLRGAVAEASFYGTDPDTGLPVKVRPDALNVKENIGCDAIISFKTTAAPMLGKFIYDSAKFTYELSEGMYQEVISRITGRDFHTTIMIMLQTVAPYLPAVFIWDEDDICNGIYKYRQAITTIDQCTKSGFWPGFDAMAESGNRGIIEMKQPNWAMKELHPVDIEE